MSKVKNQHYVPRCYLKNFTEDGHRVYVFDRLLGRSWPSNINDVASEKYFYDVTLDDGTQSQHAEEGLALAEQELADMIAEIVAAERLRPENKLRLATHLILQMQRTPAAREALVTLAEEIRTWELRHHICAELPHLDPYRHRVRLGDGGEAVLHTQTMFSEGILLEMPKYLLEHIWYLGINETDLPLYTSDTPVVRRNQYGDNIGLLVPGTEVLFPLTGRLLLVLMEPVAFKEHASLDCGRIDLSRENVIYNNTLQISGCSRQVYASRPAFELAEEFVAANPELRLPRKSAVQVRYTLPWKKSRTRRRDEQPRRKRRR